MAAIIPIIAAVAGSLASNLLAPSAPKAPEVVPPPEVPEAPEAAAPEPIEDEAKKLADARRRRQAQQSKITAVSKEDTTKAKTLLGE